MTLLRARELLGVEASPQDSLLILPPDRACRIPGEIRPGTGPDALAGGREPRCRGSADQVPPGGPVIYDSGAVEHAVPRGGQDHVQVGGADQAAALGAGESSQVVAARAVSAGPARLPGPGMAVPAVRQPASLPAVWWLRAPAAADA